MAQSNNDDDMLNRHVSWMVPADVAILQYLTHSRTVNGNPSIQTPKTIAVNTGYSRKHASNRAQVLADHGLVEKVSHGEYRLSDLGERAIKHEVPYEELEDVDESEDENSD